MPKLNEKKGAIFIVFGPLDGAGRRASRWQQTDLRSDQEQEFQETSDTACARGARRIVFASRCPPAYVRRLAMILSGDWGHASENLFPHFLVLGALWSTSERVLATLGRFVSALGSSLAALGGHLALKRSIRDP